MFSTDLQRDQLCLFSMDVQILFSSPKCQMLPTSYFHQNMQDKPTPPAQKILHG